MWRMYERYMEKFGEILDEYLPNCGEGDNLATQTVTAVHKLVRGWFDNGDIYDGTCYRIVSTHLNDLSSYANWLSSNTVGKYILVEIADCEGEWDYSWLLYRLANVLLNAETLKEKAKFPKRGTIYKCKGVYEF